MRTVRLSIHRFHYAFATRALLDRVFTLVHITVMSTLFTGTLHLDYLKLRFYFLATSKENRKREKEQIDELFLHMYTYIYLYMYIYIAPGKNLEWISASDDDDIDVDDVITMKRTG